jgi:Ca2+-binding EF-hand superfamily protein
MNETSDLAVRETFSKLDLNNDGHISVEELEHGMKLLNIPLPKEKDMVHLYSSIDENLNGMIDYNEFKLFYHNRITQLYDIFHSMDTSEDGNLSSSEIVAAIHKAGLDISSSQLRLIMHSMDSDRNGNITFDEFCRYLLLLPKVNPTAVFEHFLESVPIEAAQGEYTPPRDIKKTDKAKYVIS